MPINPKFKAAFHASKHYHLIFKSLDGLILFTDKDNRTYFLNKFKMTSNQLVLVGHIANSLITLIL
jgi:hypothetical protein